VLKLLAEASPKPSRLDGRVARDKGQAASPCVSFNSADRLACAKKIVIARPPPGLRRSKSMQYSPRLYNKDIQYNGTG